MWWSWRINFAEKLLNRFRQPPQISNLFPRNIIQYSIFTPNTSSIIKRNFEKRFVAKRKITPGKSKSQVSDIVHRTNFAYCRKLTDEIQKLSEEMRRDQLMWETNQLNKNEMMEKWWSSVLGNFQILCTLPRVTFVVILS